MQLDFWQERTFIHSTQTPYFLRKKMEIQPVFHLKKEYAQQLSCVTQEVEGKGLVEDKLMGFL